MDSFFKDKDIVCNIEKEFEVLAISNGWHIFDEKGMIGEDDNPPFVERDNHELGETERADSWEEACEISGINTEIVKIKFGLNKLSV